MFFKEEFEEEFRRRVMTGYFSGSKGRTRKVSGRVDCRAAEECAGKRQKLGSQGAGEDGTRRFQLQKTYGVGENLRTISVPESSVLSCDVGCDVVSSVETNFQQTNFQQEQV